MNKAQAKIREYFPRYSNTYVISNFDRGIQLIPEGSDQFRHSPYSLISQVKYNLRDSTFFEFDRALAQALRRNRSVKKWKT